MNLKLSVRIMGCLIAVTLLLLSCNSKEPNLLFGNEVLTDPARWIVEQQPGGIVSFNEKGIDIKDSSGCTVWFEPMIEGPVMIEYEITVIDHDGPYDRVSDMNVFWMARDPHNIDQFFNEKQPRTGQFRQYDKLELYYVGCGGHNNTRTRFRRYNGTEMRPLESEHDLSSPDVLLTPNHTYTVQLIADGQTIKYLRDGHVIFNINDSEPYTKGRFGFRIYHSHQLVSGFKVISLKK